jgi:nucleotide-binding universal stress UspA family protein
VAEYGVADPDSPDLALDLAAERVELVERKVEMYKRILVPLDGSQLAEQVLPHAAIHARQFGAEIVLLKVLGPLPEPAMSSPQVLRGAAAASAQLALEYLQGVASGLEEEGPPVQVATVEGKPYVEIVRFAEENDIDLIAMSTRGHSGLSRWLLGSVADRVARGTTIPLLLVPANSEKGEER